MNHAEQNVGQGQKILRPKIYKITWFSTLIPPPGDWLAVLFRKT